MNQFTHRALDLTKDEIRLLRVRRDEKDPNSTHFSLRKFNVDKAPKYTALSYTWGSETPLHDVAVNGKTITIRQNLQDFLCRLKNGDFDSLWTSRTLRAGHIYLWIDQLCINQDDLEEKNHQVRMMSQIYARAARVLAWLGEDDGRFNESDLVFDDATAKMSDREKEFASIFRCSYWTRLWILQEFLLARELVFLRGSRIMTWHDVCYWYRYQFLDSERIVKIFGPAINHIRMRLNVIVSEKAVPLLTFETLLYRASQLECHDPRDRVYGLLGILRRSTGIVIDYKLPPQEVFWNAIGRVNGHAVLGANSTPLVRLGRIMGVKGSESMAYQGHILKQTRRIFHGRGPAEVFGVMESDMEEASDQRSMWLHPDNEPDGVKTYLVPGSADWVSGVERI